MHILIHLTYTYDICYAISIGGRQGPYEFEGEWRGVHGRGGKKGKGEMYLIFKKENHAFILLVT